MAEAPQSPTLRLDRPAIQVDVAIPSRDQVDDGYRRCADQSALHGGAPHFRTHTPITPPGVVLATVVTVGLTGGAWAMATFAELEARCGTAVRRPEQFEWDLTPPVGLTQARNQG